MEGTALEVRFEGKSDQDTPFSPTFHPYFKLGSGAELSIQAGAYLPVSSCDLLPTGEISTVQGTPFDFRTARAIIQPLSYDHCWILDDHRPFDAELRLSSGVVLTIRSDQPGLQFYAGQHSPALQAICLEPQGLPNAVNTAGFPSIVLRSGTIFSTTFRYDLT